jgi:hypothetical protein
MKLYLINKLTEFLVISQIDNENYFKDGKKPKRTFINKIGLK